jgi:predicted ATPase/transcriptional regulator with XRE-family HTH domain
MTYGTGNTAPANGITFGVWLKQRRKEQGIGIDQFAGLLDCSAITLLKIEAGERRPSRQLAEIIAERLNIAGDEREPFITFARSGRTATSEPSSEKALRAPWRALHSRLTNLPSTLTPLIGREEDIDRTQTFILQSKVRLLTLIGAPGIGKTRLALHVASNLVSEFEDGVFMVELAPISDPGLLSATIARTLGIEGDDTQPVEEALLKYLSERRLLLLLDNFEHLLDAGPALVRLLEASPWLKVLTTSREPLRVRGERRLPVPPLSTPDSKRLPATKELAAYAAVALFVERAETVSPDFSLTDANGEDVAAICIGLEGLPLAIELAAMHANHLSPANIRKALQSDNTKKSLGLLTGGGHDLPPRQRTLRNAIEWSYNLLDQEEQALFRSLGVFVGGFTPSVVDSVLAEEIRVTPGSVPVAESLLTALADKNLLTRDRAGGEAASRDEPRWGLLETIREYALEQLAEHGEEAELRRRHALYFLALAEAAEPELVGPNQQIWLARLREERDNIRGALSWACGPGRDEELSLRLTSALLHFWLLQGHLNEGRQWLEAALEQGEDVRTSIRAKALNAAGHLARRQGDLADAHALLEESLALYRDVGDPLGIATALNNLGLVLRTQGEYDTARILFEEGLALHRELGNKGGEVMALTGLGILARTLDDQIAARDFFAESLVLQREVGEKAMLAFALSNLGLVVADLGDLAGARALFEEGLVLRRELADVPGISSSLHFLGGLARDQGDYTAASALYEEGLALSRSVGAKQGVADIVAELGRLAYHSGNYERAYTLMEESSALYREMGERRSMAVILQALGCMMREQGDYSQAWVLFEESLHIYREVGDNNSIAETLRNLGMVEFLQGNYDTARTLCQEALTLMQTGANYGTALTLTVLAGAEAGAGSGERAAMLLGAGTRLLHELDTEPVPEYWTMHGRAVELAVASIGDEAFAQAQHESQSLTLDAALEYAFAPLHEPAK